MKISITYGQCNTLLKLINSRLHAERRAREKPTRIAAREVAKDRGGNDVSQDYIDRLVALQDLLIKAAEGHDPEPNRSHLPPFDLQKRGKR